MLNCYYGGPEHRDETINLEIRYKTFILNRGGSTPFFVQRLELIDTLSNQILHIFIGSSRRAIRYEMQLFLKQRYPLQLRPIEKTQLPEFKHYTFH